MSHFVRSPYNYDRNVASEYSGVYFNEDDDESKSRTVQSDKDQADINVIVRNFGVTGMLPQVKNLPTYGDFTGVFDYQSARNAILAADQTFMSLPAELRSRFNNDPQQFVAFCSDPDNIDELVKLGLAEKKEIIDDGQAKSGGAATASAGAPSEPAVAGQSGS